MQNDVYPLISVIVPTYSRAKMLPRAIKSVAAQTYQNFEIIVVDDNGAGEPAQIRTQDVMGEFLTDQRIQYITLETNQGGSQARNIGVDRAKGEFITFLDDDDEYYPEKLERQVDYYTKHFPKNDGFINAQISVSKRGRIVRTTKPTVDPNALLFSAVSEKILGTPTFFMPKALFLSVGGFSPIPKGQEWYLSVKLIEQGAGFSAMPDTLVKVHVHDQGGITTGHSNPERLIAGIENIYEIQKGYFDRFSKKQICAMKRNHRLALTRAYLRNNLSRAAMTYLSSFRFGHPNRQTLIVFLLFFREGIARVGTGRSR